jgi:hypothetical protein
MTLRSSIIRYGLAVAAVLALSAPSALAQSAPTPGTISQAKLSPAKLSPAKPTRAKPAWLTICDDYGKGFFWVPGTQTCLAVGGEIEGDAQATTVPSRLFNTLNATVIARLALDARTNTDFGELRAFIRAPFTWQGGPTAVQKGSASGDLDYAFVQLGPFLAGRADSVFSFYNAALNIGTLRGPSLSADIARYTLALPDGLTWISSAETGTTIRPRGVRDPSLTTGVGPPSPPAGQEWPDFVTSLKLEKDWGQAFLGAAVHQARSAEPAAGSAIGGAVMAGVQLNVPLPDGDDALWLQTVYAWGAPTYLGFGRAAIIGNVGLNVTESTTLNGSSLVLSQGYAMTIAYSHVLSESWQVNAFGSYAGYDPKATSAALPFVQDFRELRVGASLAFTPVDDLTMTAEVLWGRLAAGAPVPAFPNASTTARTASGWQGTLQIIRTF